MHSVHNCNLFAFVNNYSIKNIFGSSEQGAKLLITYLNENNESILLTQFIY